MKFNKTSVGKAAVQNYMGAKSFRQSAKEELAFSVVTSFMEDTYYEKKDKRIERVKALVSEVDPLFVAKLAIVTRREFHMRSAFHVLVGELAKCHKGDSLIKTTLRTGVERPDDLLEIAAYVGKPLPNAIKKGIGASLATFDPYQLAKYKGEGKDFSMVDLFNLVHPKPDANKAELWHRLVKGELAAADTWEARLTKVGEATQDEQEKAELKAEVWRDLLAQKKLGYMAALRNLRNILKTGDAAIIKQVCALISDAEAVRRSKQLPFRFLSAYLAIDGQESKDGLRFESEGSIVGAKQVQAAILKAVGHSIENIPLLKGRTVILSDNSGSMRGDAGGGSLISALSKRTTADIANLFAVLYWQRAQDTIVGLFGDNLILPRLDRARDVFANFKQIDGEAANCGPRTETGIFAFFEKAIAQKVQADRIIIFSDCQVGDDCQWYDSTGTKRGGDFNKLFQQYKRLYPGVLTYSVDLKGYGDTLFSDGVVTLAGWSNKIFELMELVEKNEGLVKWIEAYPINLLPSFN